MADEENAMMSRIHVLRAQGAYYTLTGLWPLVHMASFEAVTGPKTDDWLVRMVGLLAAVIGATLLTAGRHRQGAPPKIVVGGWRGFGFSAGGGGGVFRGGGSRGFFGGAGARNRVVVLLLFGG